MTKKQKNRRKKRIVIAAIFMLLVIISAITTVTVLHFIDNVETKNGEGNILHYSENKNNEENDVLIVGIKEENESKEKYGLKANAEHENEEKNTATENKDKKVSSDSKYYIKVNYQENVVTIYTKDSNGEYTKPFKAMVCSCGDYTPPCKKYPDTIYKLPGRKYQWLNLQGGVCGQYATQVTGNILFHSVPYTKKDKSALEWWEYDKLGTTASAGCIRLTVNDAKWIYDNVPAGTIVEFYKSSTPGPLGKPKAQKISDDTEVNGWDPTDPDKNNPWSAYLKRKEEEAAAAKVAEEAKKKEEEKKAQEISTKPVEEKTNTTTVTQETSTNFAESKTNETTKKTETNDTKTSENKVSTKSENKI